ncbi:MAG: hypothetical protein ACREIR_23715 [Geminicoccaceae bacterium]
MPAPPPGPDDFGFTPLTPVQGQIYAALTRQPPLNPRQRELLAIYWRARRDNEPALSVEEAGRRLATALGLEPARAAAYVRGALRSFGRRLLQTLDRLPLRIGRDRYGDGVADEIPLLALLAIETGPTGEVCHRLTADGAAAVAAALGLTAAGQPAGGLQTGDPALDNPDAVVAVGMTRLAAALLLRVQKTLGLSLDATVKWLTAQAGAG